VKGQQNLSKPLVAVLLLVVLGFSLFCSCGGSNSPEKVARSWVEAIAAGNCDRAERYWSSDWTDGNSSYCGPTATTLILSAKIREVDADPEQDGYLVHVYGTFVARDMWGDEREADQLWVHLEEVNGKYYVYYLDVWYIY